MAVGKALLVGSDHEAVDAGSAAFARGNAVDAVVMTVFAAAGLHPSVLLGPVQILIGGAGAGLRAVDGRNRQPGLGNPRPRGALSYRASTPPSRVGVPGLPAALLAAATTYGNLSVAAVLGPGLELARGLSKARANVLSRIAQRGPAALAEAQVSEELTACAGRLSGGLLSVRDLDELRPDLTTAASTVTQGARELLTVPWGAEAVRDVGAVNEARAASHVRVVAAVDRHGLFAVACYEVAREGLTIEAFDLLAPFTAAPVLRGEQRVKPGELRPAAAPIALGRDHGVLDFAVGIGATSEAETILASWAASFRPTSELERLERNEELPVGLRAVQMVGSGSVPLVGSDGTFEADAPRAVNRVAPAPESHDELEEHDARESHDDLEEHDETEEPEETDA